MFSNVLSHKTISSNYFWTQNIRKCHFNDLKCFLWLKYGYFIILKVNIHLKDVK